MVLASGFGRALKIKFATVETQAEVEVEVYWSFQTQRFDWQCGRAVEERGTC